MSVHTKITKELRGHRGTREKLGVLSGFFKTGKGEYGEGDRFIGVTVPNQRSIAKKFFRNATFQDIERLLESTIHEYRLTGLLLLVYRFERSHDEKEKKAVYDFYIRHLSSVNNWDLVDTTTPNVVGVYMSNHPKEKKRLALWARSENLWERRIAVLATYAFIKKGFYDDTIRMAGILLHDEHDLIHKAVGWMLREVGKRDEKVLCDFLDEHSCLMPRTMLRYAIERLGEKRNYYMNVS